MIRDGKLAYDATPSPLNELEFESAVLNTFVIAILTTILSYQAASLAIDLFFGIKSQNKARISDIHILLLTRQSSPLAVYASILRLDWLTRLQFKGDLQEGSNIVRDNNRVHASVVWKLLFLLALVPLLNIGSIILSFTREQTISFGEAQFGGTCLGVQADLSVVEVEQFTRNCDAAVIETARTDRTNVTFSLCQHFIFRLRPDPREQNASVILQRLKSNLIALTVVVGRNIGDSRKFAQVSINGSVPFDLQSTISPASAQPLIDFGIDLLAQKCRIEKPFVEEILDNSPYADVLVGKAIRCPEFVEDTSRLRDQVLNQLTNLITLVESDVFELRKILFNADGSLDSSKVEFFRADDYPFLVRTQPYVSLPMLAIITAVLLVIRMISNLFLNNDLAEGVHRLVKKELGFLYWESLLRSAPRPRVVQYYHNDDQSVAGDA